MNEEKEVEQMEAEESWSSIFQLLKQFPKAIVKLYWAHIRDGFLTVINVILLMLIELVKGIKFLFSYCQLFVISVMIVALMVRYYL